MNKIVLCGLLAALPVAALAESAAFSAASTASLAASSTSQSLGASSNSSKGGNTARAGDYRIEAVAAAEAGKVRLVLQALQPTPERAGFVLTLPQAALEAQGLARGDTVSVRERAYGFEFARADTKQAFFLVLADDWQRELDPRPVGAARPAI